MPHIELRHSSDINLDSSALFSDIEHHFSEIDNNAGSCKSRAYPTDQYLHTHAYLHISLLPKPHRDDDFMRNLIQTVHDCVKPLLPSGCWLSVDATFTSRHYLKVQCD